MNPFEPGAYQEMVNLEHIDSKKRDFEERFVTNWERFAKKISELGGRLEEDSSVGMQRLAQQDPGMIVRRESPKSFIDALENEKPLPIRFDPEAHGGDPYPNAGVLGDDGFGLRIPFQRGFGGVSSEEGGKGKIISIIGFVPGASIHAVPMPLAMYPHYKQGKERSMIRMVEGEVLPEDVRFFMVRIPRIHVPDSFLTEAEAAAEEENEEKRFPFISRLFVFNEKKETMH